MSDASAIGTTVLQLKEIPPRPEEYNGAICIFDLADGVDEAHIRTILQRFGNIKSCEFIPHNFPPAIVRFTTHAAALAAKQASAELESVLGRIDTLYNERSYDGCDNDTGRGWCCFEAAVSVELIVRLSKFDKMRRALDSLPAKLLSLSSHSSAKPLELEVDDPSVHVEKAKARIRNATFTGKGDQAKVPLLYDFYIKRIATSLQNTLVLTEMRSPSLISTLLVPPSIVAPTPVPLRLAEGHLLLLPSRLAAAGGACTGRGAARAARRWP